MLIALEAPVKSSDLPIHENSGYARQKLGETHHGAVRAMGHGEGIVNKEVEERRQLPDHMALGMVGWAAVHILFGIKAGVLQKKDLPRPERFYGVLSMRAEDVVDIRDIPAQQSG